MLTLKKRGALAVLAAVSAFAMAGCASDSGGAASSGSGEESFSFTVGTMASDGSPSAAMQEWFLSEIEAASEGRIAFERTERESICKAAEIVDCVRDGRVEVGVSVPAYTPQYFPEAEVVGVPFLGQSIGQVQQAYASAYEGNEEIRGFYADNGLVRITNWSPGRLLIGTKGEISGPEDLEGTSARITGPIVQRLFQDAGANIVALTSAEAYEAIERGVVDSVAGSVDFPVQWKLGELLDSWVDPGIGHYTTFAMWMNLDAYESLPEDLRGVVDGVIADFNSGAALDEYDAAVVGQCEDLAATPTITSIGAWDESVTEAWSDEVLDTLKQSWVDQAESAGFESAQEFFDAYVSALESYNGAPDPVSECLPAIAR